MKFYFGAGVVEGVCIFFCSLFLIAIDSYIGCSRFI